MNLYPHNQKAADAVMSSFRSGSKRAAVVHATGTGKSYIIASVAKHFKKVLVVAPREFIIHEIQRIIYSNKEMFGDVYYKTYTGVMCEETFDNNFDLIVLDEFHHAGAEEWGYGVYRLLESNPCANVLGTTATDKRWLDGGRDMSDELFESNVVSRITLADAIRDGILPKPVVVTSLYDMKYVKREYVSKVNKTYLSKKSKREKIKYINGIVNMWEASHGVPTIINKYFTTDTRRILVFCNNTKRASSLGKLAESWLNEAGYSKVKIYNIDYKRKDRYEQMADFRKPLVDCDIKVAVSVNMLNEGVHVPDVDGIIMLRNTSSRTIIEQQIGRCLTAANNNSRPVVLDLVNNLDLTRNIRNVEFSDSVTSNPENTKKDYNIFPFDVIDESKDIKDFLECIDNEFEYRKWTRGAVSELASKYEKLSDFKRECENAYGAVCRNGWHDLLEHLSKRSANTWTKEEVISLAKECNTRREFKVLHHNAYNAARYNGWLEDACSHMNLKLKKYTREMCEELSRKYTSMRDFRNNDHGAYKYAQRHCFLEDICRHMTREYTRYTEDTCKQVASRYENRKQFQRCASGAYSYARTHNLLNVFFPKV